MNDGFDVTLIVVIIATFVTLAALALIFANRVPPSRRKYYAWGCAVLLFFYVVTVVYALNLGNKRYSERPKKELLEP